MFPFFVIHDTGRSALAAQEAAGFIPGHSCPPPSPAEGDPVWGFPPKSCFAAPVSEPVHGAAVRKGTSDLKGGIPWYTFPPPVSHQEWVQIRQTWGQITHRSRKRTGGAEAEVLDCEVSSHFTSESICGCPKSVPFFSVPALLSVAIAIPIPGAPSMVHCPGGPSGHQHPPGILLRVFSASFWALPSIQAQAQVSRQTWPLGDIPEAPASLLGTEDGASAAGQQNQWCTA